MIDTLDLVPAPGNDVDMPDGSDHSHPLGSRLPIIKSSLQTFMQPNSVFSKKAEHKWLAFKNRWPSPLLSQRMKKKVYQHDFSAKWDM